MLELYTFYLLMLIEAIGSGLPACQLSYFQWGKPEGLELDTSLRLILL